MHDSMDASRERITRQRRPGCRIIPGRHLGRVGLLSVMLLLPGYTKQIYLDKAAASSGGPGWAIRVTNRNGRTVTFLAVSWRVLLSEGSIRGCGGLDDLLTPEGPSHWVETTMAVEAQIPTLPAGLEDGIVLG